MIPPVRFTEADAERAWNEWGANCGPGAIAGICGLTLDEVRPHMGDFERKRYTNPRLMYTALRSIGEPFLNLGAEWPAYGLVCVQWEGPWTEPGAPFPARARHTHWIGTARIRDERGVFDINCINNGTGWVSLDDWATGVVPHLTAQHRAASGGWHVTHGLRIGARIGGNG